MRTDLNHLLPIEEITGGFAQFLDSLDEDPTVILIEDAPAAAVVRMDRIDHLSRLLAAQDMLDEAARRIDEAASR